VRPAKALANLPKDLEARDTATANPRRVDVTTGASLAEVHDTGRKGSKRWRGRIMHAIPGDRRDQAYHRKLGKAEKQGVPRTRVRVVAVDPAMRGMLINPWEADEIERRHCRHRSHYGE
ncbi:MAG: hypothetical protein RLY70_3909, partial [Planctomycetota bacterium]